MSGLENSRRSIRPALAILSLAWPLLAASASPPVFPGPGERLDGGQFASDTGFEIWDWNADGKPDLFVHDSGSTGKGFAYLNEGTPDRPRFTHGLVQPYNSTETEPQTLEHVQSRAYGDLNHDGLTDIVFFDGQLRFCPNTGTAHAPYWWSLWTNRPVFFPGSAAMVRENARYSTGPESMFWDKGIFARQVLTMTIADWDGDGFQDLLICRTKEEAPGVRALGAYEQWSPWGRTAIRLPEDRGRAEPDPTFLAPLKEAPARGLYFYKNRGTKAEPYFDDGVEIRTPDGRSIAAPNPVVADVDGDGIPDLISTEAPIRCNAFRVDWPTRPQVVWFRRAAAADIAALQPPQPIVDAAGKPVPAGTMARLGEFRGPGRRDLFVMDTGLKGSIRWYRNSAAPRKPLSLEPATVLRGRDFLRFGFMVQPLIADWFKPGSRDLILHGTIDPHCKWGLRRTALYRNVSGPDGGLRYELAGWFTYNGDPALAPVREEERQYEVYGSAVSVAPGDGSGKKRLMMSVGGKLYFFTDLAPDGLTFRRMKPIDIPQTRNRHKGWQEIPVTVPFPIKAVRINNDRNGMGNQRDSLLHVLRFEAVAGGRNVATSNRVTVSTPISDESKGKLMVDRPLAMLDPANANTPSALMASTWGYYKLAAVIAWPEPIKLDTIRFLFSDRDSLWYRGLVPFYWQGKLYRMGMEEGKNWYQYTVDVSPDEVTWTNIANRMETEMLVSHPMLVDWDRDGKIDLALGSTSSKGIWPNKKKYRLFRNIGSNDEPRYAEPVSASNAAGKPIVPDAYWYTAYAPQCGIRTVDLDGDGRLDLVVEGFNDGSLDFHWNAATNDSAGFVFERIGPLGSGTGPFRPGGGYRYFELADADGDGQPDLLNGVGDVWFFKGFPPDAPRPPLDVAVTGAVALEAAAAATLDAMKPDATQADSETLKVFARVASRDGEKQKVALIRFNGLPRTITGRAELSLVTTGPFTAMVSCQALDREWDPATVTWNRARTGEPWNPDELDRGGLFQSFGTPVFRAGVPVRVSWDVTPAVRRAQQAGRDSVSFLIRLDYTGHYVSGAGYVFAGPAAKEVARRPRLIFTETP